MSFQEPTFGIDNVRPSLRFLVCDAAKAEGERMVRNFKGYSSRKDESWKRSQFGSLVRGINDGRFPYIKRADEMMDGVLVQSLQLIADGYKLPDFVVHYQTWAHDLAAGRIGHMAASARLMIHYHDRATKLSTVPDDDEDAQLGHGTVSLNNMNRRFEKTVSLDHLTPEQRSRLRDRIQLDISLSIYPETMHDYLRERYSMTAEERARRDEESRRSVARPSFERNVKRMLEYLEERYDIEFPEGFYRTVLADENTYGRIKHEFQRLRPGVDVNWRLVRIGWTDDL